MSFKLPYVVFPELELQSYPRHPEVNARLAKSPPAAEDSGEKLDAAEPPPGSPCSPLSSGEHHASFSSSQRSSRGRCRRVRLGQPPAAAGFVEVAHQSAPLTPRLLQKTRASPSYSPVLSTPSLMAVNPSPASTVLRPPPPLKLSSPHSPPLTPACSIRHGRPRATRSCPPNPPPCPFSLLQRSSGGSPASPPLAPPLMTLLNLTLVNDRWGPSP